MRYSAEIDIELPEGEDINTLTCTSLLVDALLAQEQLDVKSVRVHEGQGLPY